MNWKAATKDDLLIIAERLSGIPERHDSEKDEKRAFDCIKCGERYTPFSTEDIYYDLCDACFAQFNEQKMAGRLGLLGWAPMKSYTENVQEWVKQNASQAR